MSMSVNSSSSSSTPTYIETPQNSILDQISQYASSLAGQMYNWAQSTFAKTSQITDQAVGNFFNVSQQMQGLSNNLTGQYNNLFAPENAQLVAEANSYASPARMAVDMGQAGATAAQAGQAGLSNSEEALRSYGIDPSSGRYAALDKAAAVQNAANVAGAENTQRNADIATGQKLRSEAVQVGAQLPAAIANANNTAIQANTGASNATLANANTGRSLMALPNDYLGTAMGLKLPPTGQNSFSNGMGSSSSPGGSRGSGGGGGGAVAPGPGGPPGGGQAWGMNNKAYGGPAAFGTNGVGNNNYSFNSPIGGIDPGSFSGSSNYYNPDPNGAMASIGQGGTNADIFGGNTGTGAWNGSFGDTGAGGMGQTYDYGGQNNTFTGSQGAFDTQWGNMNYDPSANQASGWGDTGSGTSDPFTADNSGYDPNANWGDTSAYGSGSYNQGGGSSYDTTSPSSDFYAGDYTSGSSADMGGAYAAGGPIPAAASPSGGVQTDDIPAQSPGGQPLRMNANEFVIPQDVALWKGQEFFQNLINDSRKKRLGAPAKPKPMMAG